MFTPTLSYHPAELEGYAHDATLGSDIFTNGVESEMNYDHQGRLQDKEANGSIMRPKLIRAWMIDEGLMKRP